jgi:hypothetical protein
VPEASEKIYNLPKINLSPPERMWLGIVCNWFKSGYLVNVDQLKRSLHSQGDLYPKPAEALRRGDGVNPGKHVLIRCVALTC